MTEPLRIVPDAASKGTFSLALQIVVDDREMIADLEAFPEGRERAALAFNALRIGLLALRRARGRIDADTVRVEGERILTTLNGALKGHEELLTRQVKETLSAYFDPRSGKFSERVDQLLRKDGDLERALKDQLSGEGSALGKTLAQSVGRDSALLKLLDPAQSGGVVSLVGKTVEKELAAQRERILNQFSLDQPDSALSRLLMEVGKTSGALGADLKTQIDRAVGELSLDNDGSALHRLRAQLLSVIGEQNKANGAFQADVRDTLTRLAERKAEAARSTRHGITFEEEVGRLVIELATRAGDIAVPKGSETGLVRASKKGDFVIEIGPSKYAAGAKIVVEAKEVAGYTLTQARTELEEARRNRGASVGLFVFSHKTAPPGIESLVRFGEDIYVTWDAEAPATDIWIHAGVTLASALVSKASKRSDETREDLECLDKAVNEIERQAREMDQIRAAAETIQGGASKILERVRIARAALERQVESLRQGLAEFEQDELESGAPG